MGVPAARQSPDEGRGTEFMDGMPRYIVMAALLAVSLVLLAGLWNMLRGSNPNLSQTLMRWRVGLQFLAVVIMMVLVYLLRP
jgi:hypothetical protein